MFTRLREWFATFDKWVGRVLIALGILLLVGYNLAVAGMWYRQIRSASFPVVEGVVLGHKQVPSGKHTKLAIEYEYEVNGTRLISDRHWYETLGANYVTDATLAARFAVGARVPVAVDPADPTDAVLLPGLQGVDVVALWVLFVVDFGLLFLASSGRPNEGADYSAARCVTTAPFGWSLSPRVGALWRTFGAAVLIGLAIAFFIARECFGLFPTVLQAVGLTAAPVAGAAAWVMLGRTRVRLEVDTERRELRWHSGAPFARTFRLPFEAVTDIRAWEHEYEPGRSVSRIEIFWYTSRQRTQRIDLPLSSNRAPLDALVAALREDVFGAAGPPQLPD